jgi:hypothetical protein
MGQTSELFKAHVDELTRRVEEHDDVFAQKSLACLALLAEGWRYGDPDPTDPPPDGGCDVDDDEDVIDLSAYRLKLAA